MMMQICTICRGIDDPSKQRSIEQTVVDVIIVLIFTSEACLKIIAAGFALGKNSYLKDPWNVLDFVVMVKSTLAKNVTMGI